MAKLSETIFKLPSFQWNESVVTIRLLQNPVKYFLWPSLWHQCRIQLFFKMPVHVTVELSIKYLLVLALILQTLSYFYHSCIVVQIIVCFGLSKGTLFIQFRMLSVMHTNRKKIHQRLPSGLDKLLQSCSGPSGKYILWNTYYCQKA